MPVLRSPQAPPAPAPPRTQTSHPSTAQSLQSFPAPARAADSCAARVSPTPESSRSASPHTRTAPESFPNQTPRRDQLKWAGQAAAATPTRSTPNFANTIQLQPQSAPRSRPRAKPSARSAHCYQIAHRDNSLPPAPESFPQPAPVPESPPAKSAKDTSQTPAKLRLCL